MFHQFHMSQSNVIRLYLNLLKMSSSSSSSSSSSNKAGRAVVLVVGDVGRSPRMMNHALSFARAGVDVALVGNVISELPGEI